MGVRRQAELFPSLSARYELVDSRHYSIAESSVPRPSPSWEERGSGRYAVSDASTVLRFLWQRSGLTVRDIANRSADMDIKIAPSVLTRLFQGDTMYPWPLVEHVARILAAAEVEIDLLRHACAAQQSQRNLSVRKGTRGSEPDPIECESAEEFVGKLNEVHIWAGEPSLRQLATASGGRLRRSTISDMLTGSRLPKEMMLIAFLETCGITGLPTWKVTWRRLRIKERNERKERREAEAALPKNVGLAPPVSISGNW